ncbi:hypothetical protein SAMN05216262_10997 [Colwellia chukchiensis]|uniref:Uncharacterized protein n=1 Tax=Colwellia chukchiensis TaxID=641665 RepID=A0A1H7PFR4_9GAMM|nr:hypothetical protein [Colwellia chukchiensis]SEL34284.1 hypothetical protein SAMN05216262_10997 [Colwellia chukchiensis]
MFNHDNYCSKCYTKLRIVLISLATFALTATASEEDALAKAQAQMNAEVLSKPFLAERPKEVDSYIKSMLEKKVKPPEYSGTYWRPGYTCRDLLRYNWVQYRNCRYYYRYYGRYYPY